MLLLHGFLSFGANYYVNDASTTGDVYTSNPGLGSNNGTDASTPKLQVQDVIDSYALTGGDTVFIDAGTYVENIVLTSSDDGSVGSYVVFIGVDSVTSELDASANDNVVYLNSASYTSWEQLAFLSNNFSSNGMLIGNNSDFNLVHNCRFNQPQFEWGVQIAGGAASAPDNNEICRNRVTADKFGITITSNPGPTVPDANEIYDNYVDIGTSAGGNKAFEIDGGTNSIIHRNTFIDGSPTVSMNTGYTGSDFYNNYIVTSSAGASGVNFSFSTAAACNVYNNSFYTNGTCLEIDGAASADPTLLEVVNNIFHTTSSTATEYCIEMTGTSDNFSVCDNNQYYHPNAALCANKNGTDYDNLSDWQDVDHESGGNDGDDDSAEGDPMYNGPVSADLSIVTASPIINSAIVLGIVTVDHDLNARPLGKGVDIGAYEVTNHVLSSKVLMMTGQCTEENYVALETQLATSPREEELTLQVKNENGSFPIDFIHLSQEAILHHDLTTRVKSGVFEWTDEKNQTLMTVDVNCKQQLEINFSESMITFKLSEETSLLKAVLCDIYGREILSKVFESTSNTLQWSPDFPTGQTFIIMASTPTHSVSRRISRTH